MSGVKWEPSALTFPIALSKPSVAELAATNTTSEEVYSFKVKTTNPKRYCVRPNVGVIWAGKEARVSVQLPAMREYPSDMNKCKDKFQVLTLKLDSETAASLADAEREGSAEAQRKILSDLWASEGAKEATVDKVRCAFSFDKSYRGSTIPEEEHPVAPYSPEATPAAMAEGSGCEHAANTTPAAHTPTDGGGNASAASSAASAPSRDAAKALAPALHASELQDRLIAAERANADLKATAAQQAARLSEAHRKREGKGCGTRGSC